MKKIKKSLFFYYLLFMRSIESKKKLKKIELFFK